MSHGWVPSMRRRPVEHASVQPRHPGTVASREARTTVGFCDVGVSTWNEKVNLERLMRIGYFADGPWSHSAFDRLIRREALEIAFVCARFDRPDQTLKGKAESQGIPFLVHRNINSEEFMRVVGAFGCDLFVSMSFNQIFRKPIMSLTPSGVINCHAGKLPYYRGRNILNWALINDEREFGITVHYVDEGVDTGDIIKQRCFPITDSDDYGTLLNRAYEGCAILLDEAIGDMLAGRVTRLPQRDIDALGFYCSARVPGDERLDWSQPSRRVFNFVRSICPPGPSARCFNGDHEVIIHRVEYIEHAPRYICVPGAVVAKDDVSFFVKTLDSCIRVVDWQTDSKIKVGDRLK